MFDVAIVGGGPAGATCAAFCADAGWRTLLLERDAFPREKVCGDCLNPACWPVLERLRVSERVRGLPHGRLSRVDFISIAGRTVSVGLPDDAEIAVKRSLFDELLLNRAIEAGAKVHQRVTISTIARQNSATGWILRSAGDLFEARVLVAADGRNSTVARLLRLLPPIEKERIALQTHVPRPLDFGDRVVLQFLHEGYSGQAPVTQDQLNLCLVGRAATIPALRRWAEERFGVPHDHVWRSITPLRRRALPAADSSLFLIGDAARVVEPFTGEGIYYALRSGELAATAIDSLLKNGDADGAARSYAAAHAELYRGRLWVNRVARAAVLSPRITSMLLDRGAIPQRVLRALTAKIVQ